MNFTNKIFKGVFQIYIAILSAIPTEIGIQLRYFLYKPFFKRTKGKFRIDSGVTISGFQNIELGEGVQIQRNSHIFVLNAELKLGYKFFLGINSQIYAVREDILIGDYCMIAPNCVLVSDNHCFENIEQPMMEQGFDIGKIVLEDDIWVGSNSVILKGVTIKKGSIVAAGGIVNKNVESYSIVGGVPAKLIKNRTKND